jgi:hypothetical protein
MRSAKLELASVGTFALTGSQGWQVVSQGQSKSVWSDKGVMK